MVTKRKYVARLLSSPVGILKVEKSPFIVRHSDFETFRIKACGTGQNVTLTFSREVDMRFFLMSERSAASCFTSPAVRAVTEQRFLPANHHFPTKRNATYIYICSLPSGLVSLRTCGCWFIRPSPARLPDADNIGGFS